MSFQSAAMASDFGSMPTLNIMFIESANTMFINRAFTCETIRDMHETMVRLYEAALTLKGLKTPTEVARALNQSQQVINNWERRGISKAGMLKAQGALGCSATWLETGIGPMTTAPGVASAELTDESGRLDPELGAFEDTNHRRLPKGRRIPVVGQAQGGPDGYISIHDYPPEHSDGWIVLPSQDPAAYGLRVRGDSMRPRIKSGEFILVEPSFEAQPGDDVVVKFDDGSAVAKELLWVRDDEVCLGSINNGVPPMTRPLSSVLTIHRIAAIIPRGSPFHQTDD